MPCSCGRSFELRNTLSHRITKQLNCVHCSVHQAHSSHTISPNTTESRRFVCLCVPGQPFIIYLKSHSSYKFVWWIGRFGFYVACCVPRHSFVRCANLHGTIWIITPTESLTIRERVCSENMSAYISGSGKRTQKMWSGPVPRWAVQSTMRWRWAADAGGMAVVGSGFSQKLHTIQPNTLDSWLK